MSEILKDICPDYSKFIAIEASQCACSLKPDEAFDLILCPESLKKKLPNGVLGIIEGPYFVPDGYSRNKRFYPKQLWENCLKSKQVQEALNLGMKGCIDHPATPAEAHPSLTSHVTKKLWIENKRGFGRSYVIDTPQGRILSVLASAVDESGDPLIKIFMSSRAYGKYKGKDAKGNMIMDENNYILHAFDVVFDPGFLEAHPEYKTSLNEAFSLYQHKEFVPLLEGKQKDKEQEVIDMTIEEIRAEYKKKIDELKAKLEAWEAFETDPKSLKELFDKVNSFLEAHGSLEDVEVKLALVKDYEELGSPEEIKEAIERANGFFEKYGEPEKLEALFGTHGEPDKIEEALIKTKEFFDTHGEPEKITLALESAYSELLAIKCEALANKYNLTVEKVQDLYESVEDFEKLETLLADLSDAAPRKPSIRKTDESKEKSLIKSLAHRIAS